MRAVPDAQRMLPGRRAALALAGAVVAVALGGCGASTNSSGSIMIAGDEPPQIRRGAVLFRERCSGCHTFDAAGAQGSKPLGQISGGERTNGPNFSVRREEREDVLDARSNGWFSGAIMQANICVGQDAQAIADFMAKYTGGEEAPTGGPGRRDTGGGTSSN
jgi:mono/diheme cytochrome c family protein